MTYDAFNHLKTAENEKYTAAYSYNPSGMRLSKEVNGERTTHVWDGSNIVMDLNSVGAIQDRYIRGVNLIASDKNGYYAFNAHGDVTQLTNTSGEVAKNYTYDAFGVEENLDDADVNPFRYCGEYFDSSSGNYYLRARYYNPSVGRFITEDPIMDGLNWYTYCSNNPIIRIDPSGLVDVILSYITKKNGGIAEAIYNYNANDLHVSKTKVDVTIGDKTVRYDGRIINGRMIVDSEKFGKDFNITDEKLLTHQVGDGFESVDDAALAWALTYNPISIYYDVEYASAIYSDNNSFKYTEPLIGTQHNVTIPNAPGGYDISGIIHAHGGEDSWEYDSNNFSPQDRGAAVNLEVPIYLSTPEGYFKKYNPFKRAFKEKTFTKKLSGFKYE